MTKHLFINDLTNTEFNSEFVDLDAFLLKISIHKYHFNLA